MTNISRPTKADYYNMVADATLEVLSRPSKDGKEVCEFFSCQRDSFNAIATVHCGHPDIMDEPEGNCFHINCPTGAYSKAKTVAMHEIAELSNTANIFTSFLGTLPDGEVEQALVGNIAHLYAAQPPEPEPEPSLQSMMDEGEHALIDGVMAVADSVAGHVLLQAPSLYSTLYAAQAYAENASAEHEIRAARAKRLAPPPAIWPFSAGSWGSVPTSDNGARTQDVCFAIGLLMAGLVIARRASFAADAAVAEAASLP